MRTFVSTHARIRSSAPVGILFIIAMMLNLTSLVKADDSLMAYLKFDEGKGTIARDFSGHDNSATLINVEWVGNGVGGGAVALNGKNSNIVFEKSGGLDFTHDFTLSVWLKIKAFDGHGRSLWVRGNYVKGWQSYIYRSFIAFSSTPARTKGAGVCRCKFAPGTEDIYPFEQIVLTGRKIDDDKTKITFYANGQKLKSFHADALPTSPRLSFGGFASNEGQWFNGVIDEMKVYNRPLTAEEIKADYARTKKAAQNAKASSPLPAVSTKQVELPPIEKKRVAIFAPAPNFPGAKTAAEFTERLEKDLQDLGLRVERLGVEQLGDPNVVNTDNVDTLILPFRAMPFKGETTIFDFLKQGGCLITVTCTPTTWNREPDGTIKSKQHTRGWYAPFLIRHLPFDWARRMVDQKVGLNPAAADVVGNLLPPVAGPYPKDHYKLVDRWNLQPCVTGRTGDGGDSKNVCLAADVMLPLYTRANGEPTDFHVYRYFNNNIFNGTLIELGAVGTELLRSPKSGDVLRALLHFAENKLPGEQDEDYYRLINKLRLDWSDIGWLYIDTLAKLRDAAFFSFLNENDQWKECDKRLIEVETLMGTLAKLKTSWNETLSSEDSDKIKAASEQLKDEYGKVKGAFNDARMMAKKILGDDATARTKVPVQNDLGELLVESYLSLPVNSHMLRTWNYEARKKLGVNIVSGRKLPFHPWYLDDPEIVKNLEGLRINAGIQYYFTKYVKPSSGTLNPLDESIKDAPPKEYQHEKARQLLKERLGRWIDKGITPFRIGLADETGLGLKYWGTQAKDDFQSYLTEEYGNDIKALNKHWGTSYPSFKDIELPTRKPETPSEHAAWEHWRILREKKFEGYAKAFYEAVKEISPTTAVSNIVSTGSLESPLYGVNFYNVSKYQDINGIDGTAVASPKEWLYLDLTRKPVLTCEWGGLYNPSTLSYVNGKLWEELTGGTLGFDFWCWQFADSNKNYVDFSGQPTLYGNRARGTVDDAKKIEHVIMDGKRVKPEIGILFSHTSRTHDQAWGSHGNKTISPHVQAVTNYYERFLKFHRSARVVPEEKVLEENIDYLKALIVPRAEFLSRAVQEKLLEYVKQGGTLILEGNVGKFDNFGQPSNALFRSALVTPSHTSGKAITINGDECPVVKNDSVFSPTPLSGKADILATYDNGDPAVLEKQLGKGNIVFIGFSAGLERYAILQQLLHSIWKKRSLTPRFVVSDDHVLLREWKHGDDTYLLLASRSKGPETFPLEIQIRGECDVEDYLFGKNVKTTTKNGYTTFNTLMANGGRVFRIPNGAPAESSENVVFEFTEAPRREAGKTDEKIITLPYKGNIYADMALKWDEYVFSNSTIASGIDQHDGVTYIIISHDDERQKKRVEVGKDYYYRMRDATFKIRSTNNFYKFPFHSAVAIEKVDVTPDPTGAWIRTTDEKIIVGNDLIQLRINPTRGGMITGISLSDDQVNQVASHGGALCACSENIGQVPGPFASQPFSSKIVTNSKEEVILELFNEKPLKSKLLRKNITMRSGVSGFSYDLRCFNLDSNPEAPPYELRWHPELSIGGVCDNADQFFIALADGVERFNYAPSNSGKSFMNPGGDWAAVVDSGEKLAYVTSYQPKQVSRVYLWLDSSFYDLEIFSHKRQVKLNESIDLNLFFCLLRGVSGLDAFSDGVGAHVVLSENINQKELFRFKVEIASAFEKMSTVNLSCSLSRGDKEITDFGGPVTDTVAFDQPIKRVLEENLSEQPDGVCQLNVSIKTDNRPEISITKEVRLAGTQISKLMGFYEKCRNSIRELRNASTENGEKVFNLCVALEEFHGKIASGQLAEAEIQRERLKEAINQVNNEN